MNSALRCGSVLLIVCLLCSVATPVGGELAQQETDGTQITITPNANGTNYLAPVNPDTEGYERVNADASSAASITAQTIHSRYESRTFDEELIDANQTQQSSIADAQLTRIEAQFEEVAQHQQELYEAYADGELSERGLLRGLVIQQMRAHNLRENYEQANSYTDLAIERRSQLKTLTDGLTPEQPATDLVREAFLTDEQQVVYLQASDGGLTLGTVTDRQFTRQATVLDERDFAGQDLFKLSQNLTIGDDMWDSTRGYNEALNRLEELYPWANERGVVDPGEISLYSRIYGLGLTNPQGELTAYFDGATRNVFHENQVGSVDQYSIEGTIDNSTDSLTVSLGLTHQSGPLRVTVEDDGSPVEDATVQINGNQIGSTAGDGTLWTVQPLNGFEVTVTTPAGEKGSVSFP